MFDQTAHLRCFGRAVRPGFLLHLFPLWRQFWSAKFVAGMGHQFSHPNLLGSLMLLVEILGATLPTGGLSQSVPSAGLVGSALIEVRIDKGFRQRHRMTPTLLPVLRQPPQHELHKTAD